MNELTKQLGVALQAASDHLDYCGYGDSWEYECAQEAGIEELIEKALARYNEAVEAAID